MVALVLEYMQALPLQPHPASSHHPILPALTLAPVLGPPPCATRCVAVSPDSRLIAGFCPEAKCIVIFDLEVWPLPPPPTYTA